MSPAIPTTRPAMFLRRTMPGSRRRPIRITQGTQGTVLCRTQGTVPCVPLGHWDRGRFPVPRRKQQMNHTATARGANHSPRLPPQNTENRPLCYTISPLCYTITDSAIKLDEITDLLN